MDVSWDDMSDFMRYVGGSAAGAVTLGAVTATAAAWYYMNRTPAVKFPVDLYNQTQEVPGVGYARMSQLCEEGELIERCYTDVGTMLEAFQRGARTSKNGKCLGWREGDSAYKWVSYNDVLSRAKNVGSGIVHLGLKPLNSTRVGIYSQNRVEYMVTELACYSYSMVIVPLYDTLGPDACSYIINQAEIEIAIVDKASKLKTLLDHHEGTNGLKYIVCMEEWDSALTNSAQSKGIKVISFTELEKNGENDPQKPKPASAEDYGLICYTSGTTGNPKGAMITHANVVAVISAVQMQLEFLEAAPDCIKGEGNGDSMISYLPLAHMYERICQFFMYVNGCQVGFYRGDVKLLMDDIGALKPTVFPTVPRLLNRVYDKVMANVNSSSVKKMLFNMGLSSKLSDVRRGIVRNDTIWDRLVFAKVQSSLGGRCRVVVCGSAPLAPKILDFMRCASGAVVLEGYGSTECSAVASLHLPGDGANGHVGAPLACSMMKVVDVPDMGYFAKDGKGEICVKGPNVFNGYLKLADKTAEALDSHGWLHTGDIGMWTQEGSLKIIDRKKNIFKLAQGEYVAPEKVENTYIRSPAIAQMFVHGESLQSCIVGVAVPDPETFKKWCKQNTKAEGSIQDLCTNKEVKAAVLKDLTILGKQSGLYSFEQVKDIHLHPELFSVENGLLTPTFKSKRTDLQKRFRSEIEEMYRRLT